MEALGINLGYLIVQIGSFTVLFLILNGLVYKPLINMLEKRTASIQQGLEDAEVAAEARANAEAEAEKIVESKRAEASEIVRQATVRAEEAEKEVKLAAQREIEEMRKQARKKSKKSATRCWAKYAGKLPLWQCLLPRNWLAKRWMKNASTF